MTKCKTCGTPLDEVPFYPCDEHKIHSIKQPSLSQEEEDNYMEQELLIILYERTGDD